MTTLRLANLGDYKSVGQRGIGLITWEEKQMARRTVPYEEILSRDLQDPEEAVAYLNAALGGRMRKRGRYFPVGPTRCRQGPRLETTRSVQDTRLSRESLYRTLSRKGNPRFSTLEAVLKSVGLKLAVEVKPIVYRVARMSIA